MLPILLLGLAASPPAVAQEAAPVATVSEEDKDLDTDGIDGPERLPNFHEVSPGVYRSGQPNRQGLADLAARGVSTVLSLRMWPAKGEPQEVRRLGMRSATIPMDGVFLPPFWAVDLAVGVLRNPARRPVLVHCKFGKDRTGVVVAAYRVVAEGWTPKAAAAEAKAIGCCVPTFDDLETWLKIYRAYRGGGFAPMAVPRGRELRLPELGELLERAPSPIPGR